MGKLDLNKNVDVDKVVEVLLKQTQELEQSKQNEAHLINRLKMAESSFATKRSTLNGQIQLEMGMKNQAMEKIEELENKVRLYELANSKEVDGNLAEIWKKKFEEMYSISQKLLAENKALKKDLTHPSHLSEQRHSETTSASHSQLGAYNSGNLFFNTGSEKQ